MGSSHLFLLSAGGGGVLAICPPDCCAALSSAPVSIVTCPIDSVGNLVTVFSMYFSCIVLFHFVLLCILLLYFCFECSSHFLYRPVIAAAVEDHCLVLRLGLPAVWLSFLACAVPAVSWTPDSCHHLDDRHSVPGACLPCPPLVPFGLIDTVCLGPVFLIPGLTMSSLTVDFVCMYVRMVCLSRLELNS